MLVNRNIILVSNDISTFQDSIATPICEIRVEENGFFVEYVTQDMVSKE